MKKGSNAVKKAQLKGKPRQCKKGARQFDKYCHQYAIKDGHRRKTPKYTDYTNADGACDHDDDLSQAICLGQQCMFEYCIWRRDEWLEECADEDGEVELPVEEPGWGDVYDYGNMHADLDTNPDTDGIFESAVCTEYYAFIDDNLLTSMMSLQRTLKMMKKMAKMVKMRRTTEKTLKTSTGTEPCNDEGANLNFVTLYNYLKQFLRV